MNVKKALDLLLLCACFNRVICDVTYITPGTDLRLCSQHPCFTLSQLTSRNDKLNKAELTMDMISGNHILTNQFRAENLQQLTMMSRGNVTITCQQLGSFTLKVITQVNISSVTFMRCNKNRIVMVKNLVLSDLIFYSQDMHSVMEINYTSAIITRSSFIRKNTHNRLIPEYGGALVVVCSNITLRGSSFVSHSGRWGGAIYATQENKLVMVNSRFDGNMAMKGGVLFADGKSFINITDSSFTNNVADYGGAVNIENSNATIVRSIFDNNTAQSRNGGAMFISGQSFVAIINSDISNNTAVFGGGLYSHNCETFVSHCVLVAIMQLIMEEHSFVVRTPSE